MTTLQITRLAKKHPFWKHVSVGAAHECWPWNGATDRDGYGLIGRDRAHRAAFELQARRDLLCGEVVRHTCDNPICCNPRHLAAGSQQQNVSDRDDRGRTAKGTFNGKARLTNSQVLLIATAAGSYQSIADRFGVGKSAVADIKTGRNWSWLTGRNSHQGSKIPISPKK